MLRRRLAKPLDAGPGLFQLRALGAKVTALVHGDAVTLVDAGSPGSLPLIARGLEQIGVSIEQVRLIVLTHYHPDHVGGLASLVDATHAPVAAHRDDVPFITGAVPPPNPVRWKLLAWPIRPLVPHIHGRPVPVDHPLEDGDALPGRPDIRTIHTPGHTPGSICLHVESTGALIVGDALQYRFRMLSPPSPIVSWDSAQAFESLRSLASVDFDSIWFSHFPPLKRDARTALRRLVAARTRRPRTLECKRGGRQ